MTAEDKESREGRPPESEKKPGQGVSRGAALSRGPPRKLPQVSAHSGSCKRPCVSWMIMGTSTNKHRNSKLTSQVANVHLGKCSSPLIIRKRKNDGKRMSQSTLLFGPRLKPMLQSHFLAVQEPESARDWARVTPTTRGHLTSKTTVFTQQSGQDTSMENGTEPPPEAANSQAAPVPDSPVLGQPEESTSGSTQLTVSAAFSWVQTWTPLTCWQRAPYISHGSLPHLGS